MGHTTEPYELRASATLDDKAHLTLNVTPLPDEDHVVAFRFDGTCPGCDGPMTTTYPIVGVVDRGEPLDEQAIIEVADALGIPAGDVDVLLHCTCGPEHEDHPDDELGCGARFSIHVHWEPS